jgi:hypothetical protein
VGTPSSARPVYSGCDIPVRGRLAGLLAGSNVEHVDTRTADREKHGAAPPSLLSRRALAIALSPQVVKLGLRTSLVIGSLLNLINQGDALFGAAPLVVGKLLLTYLVPYCVATYSATSISLSVQR